MKEDRIRHTNWVSFYSKRCRDAFMARWNNSPLKQWPKATGKYVYPLYRARLAKADTLTRERFYLEAMAYDDAWKEAIRQACEILETEA